LIQSQHLVSESLEEAARWHAAILLLKWFQDWAGFKEKHDWSDGRAAPPLDREKRLISRGPT